MSCRRRRPFGQFCALPALLPIVAGLTTSEAADDVCSQEAQIRSPTAKFRRIAAHHFGQKAKRDSRRAASRHADSRTESEARVLLTTFWNQLSESLRRKLGNVCGRPVRRDHHGRLIPPHRRGALYPGRKAHVADRTPSETSLRWPPLTREAANKVGFDNHTYSKALMTTALRSTPCPGISPKVCLRVLHRWNSRPILVSNDTVEYPQNGWANQE